VTKRILIELLPVAALVSWYWWAYNTPEAKAVRALIKREAEGRAEHDRVWQAVHSRTTRIDGD
jgi:uncharacterized protein involved in tolerance to divalent cations